MPTGELQGGGDSLARSAPYIARASSRIDRVGTPFVVNALLDGRRTLIIGCRHNDIPIHSTIIRERQGGEELLRARRTLHVRACLCSDQARPPLVANTLLGGEYMLIL